MMEYLFIALTLTAYIGAFLFLLYGIEFLFEHNRTARRLGRWLWRKLLG